MFLGMYTPPSKKNRTIFEQPLTCASWMVKLDKLMLDYLKDGWGFVCGVEGPNIQPNLMSEICGLSVTMCVEMLKCYVPVVSLDY